METWEWRYYQIWERLLGGW